MQKKKSLQNENGMSFVLILLLITIVIIIGGAISYSSVFQLKTSMDNIKRSQAYYIAKSGAEVVATAIEKEKIAPEDLFWKESTPNQFGEGEFSVDIEKDGSSILINSTGTVEDINENLTLELTEGSSPLDMAFFGMEDITMSNGIILGNLGTNSTGAGLVNLENSPSISGDLYIGPDGERDTTITYPSHTTDFSVRNLREKREYPEPKFPEPPSSMMFYYYRGNELIVGYDNDDSWFGSHKDYMVVGHNMKYNKIVVETKLIINIYDYDLYINTKNFSVIGEGEVIVNTKGKGKLKLFIDKEFILDASAAFNENGNSEDVILFYGGTKEINPAGETIFNGNLFSKEAPITISGSGGITGNIISGGEKIEITGNASAHVRTIYAPKADFLLKESGHITGTAVGKSLYIDGNSTVEYDDSVAGFDPNELFITLEKEYKRTWR
ncbi:MAG: hypothetical protein ACOCQW_01550 [Halanaerobiaceae bacterium]